jgi:adenylyl-sulfate kinase
LKSAKIIWFTGLSGSGKSTLANKLFSYLIEGLYKVKIIDGDAVREKDKKFRFTTKEIIINNQRIIELCGNLQKEYDYLLVTVIAPFKKTRKEAKEKFLSNYIEIYVKTNLETVIERDTKGLYNKALRGKLSNMIGLDSGVPYEEPIAPSIIIDTNDDSIDNSFTILINQLCMIK